MQIGELARRGGVTVQTVRFYERRGLLPPPIRADSGYRIYGEQEVRRLYFIRQAKTLGFTLDEIRDILGMRERGKCPCSDVVAMGERRLRDVARQIRHLSKFRAELASALRTWKRSEKKLSANAFCPLIERTIKTPRSGSTAG